MTDWQLLLDHVGCGAWPFLRGGLICVVHFFNERDPIPLTRFAEQWLWGLLRGTLVAVIVEWRKGAHVGMATASIGAGGILAETPLASLLPTKPCRLFRWGQCHSTISPTTQHYPSCNSKTNVQV